MSLASIILFCVLAYTVYLIFEDSAKKGNDNRNVDTNTQEAEVDKTEETNNVTEAVPVSIERKDKTKYESNDGTVTLKQGEDYNPSSNQRVQSVVSTDTCTVNKPEEAEEIKSSSKDAVEDECIQQHVGTQKLACPYCDLQVDVPEGGSVVCPRCGGTVSWE